MEGGELLLSINTVRPFSLAAGLERTEKKGLNSKCQRFWGTGCGKPFFWHQYSCTFGPDGIEIKHRNKKQAQIPKVSHRVILW